MSRSAYKPTPQLCGPFLRVTCAQFSVDDFEEMKTTAWEGVRNHEAKNLMKEMQIGDQVRHGGSEPDPRDLLPTDPRRQDIYIPDLHLDTIRVKTRDFR